MTDFLTRRLLALELLSHHHEHQTRKSSQFLGQVACDALPLTPRQEEWLGQLADRAGLTVEA